MPLMTPSAANGGSFPAAQPRPGVANSPFAVTSSTAVDTSALKSEAVWVYTSEVIHVRFKDATGDAGANSGDCALPRNSLHCFSCRHGQFLSMIAASTAATVTVAEAEKEKFEE